MTFQDHYFDVFVRVSANPFTPEDFVESCLDHFEDPKVGLKDLRDFLVDHVENAIRVCNPQELHGFIHSLVRGCSLSFSYRELMKIPKEPSHVDVANCLVRVYARITDLQDRGEEFQHYLDYMRGTRLYFESLDKTVKTFLANFFRFGVLNGGGRVLYLQDVPKSEAAKKQAIQEISGFFSQHLAILEGLELMLRSKVEQIRERTNILLRVDSAIRLVSNHMKIDLVGTNRVDSYHNGVTNSSF